MRLSEAIRLGSLAIQNPQAGEIRSCALGMANTAIGYITTGDVDTGAYNNIKRNWPWTTMRNGYSLTLYYRSIYDTFDCAVMRGKMSLEALCDQVRAWEDELAAKGINVEQVTMAAELTEPASQAAEHTEKEWAVEAK